MNDENNILNEVKELFDIKAAANEDELLPNELGIEDGNVDFSEKAEDVKNKSEKFKKTALELKIFEKKTDLINSEKDDKKEEVVTKMAEISSNRDLLDKSLKTDKKVEKTVEDELFGEFEIGDQKEVIVEKTIDSNITIDYNQEVEQTRKEQEAIKEDVVVSSVGDKAESVEVDNEKEEQPLEPHSYEAKNNVEIVDGKIQWILQISDPKWKDFYKYKQNCWNVLFSEEEPILYGKVMKELKECSVEMKGIWEGTSVFDEMRSVQIWRERIRQIQVDCSKHYFLLERILPLLRGVIDFIQYAKPASRQEGLYYIHLRDFEIYYAWVKAVRDASENTVKTLDKAFETLSRQITIMAPQREAEKSIDRLSQDRPNKYKQYDTLETNQTGSSPISRSDKNSGITKDEDLDGWEIIK